MPPPFPAIETLLPHRPPMRWIDALTACTDTTASARACIRPDDFATAAGLVLESVLVEYIAQTAAAAEGYRRMVASTPESRGNRDSAGMLAAVSNFRIRAHPGAGQVLDITVREIKRFGPMLLVYGEISSGAELVASGELTIHA